MSDNLEYPQSRTEKILMNILDKISGGSGNKEDIIKIRDRSEYHGKITNIENNKIIDYKQIDPIEGSEKKEIGIRIYIILADGLDNPEVNERYFSDIRDFYSDYDYENIRFYTGENWYINANYIEDMKSGLESMDPDIRVDGTITFQVSAGFEKYNLNNSFANLMLDLLISNIPSEVYSQYYSALYEIIDNIEHVDRIEFDYKGNDNIVFEFPLSSF